MDCKQILSELELRIIRNDLENFSFEYPSNLINESVAKTFNFACNSLIKQDYKCVLQIPLADYGLRNSTTSDHTNFVDNGVFNEETKFVKDYILLIVGISALQEFLRSNFTGPGLKVSEQYNVVSDILPDVVFSENDIIKFLSIDSEFIYSNVVCPRLLYLSYILLSGIKNDILITSKWWLMRSVFIHQRVLPERNEGLHNKLQSLIKDISNSEWINERNRVTEKLHFSVESAHVHLYYGEISAARIFISDSIAITGLEIELSGALGKRTQYQEKAIAQLFVKIKRDSTFVGTLAKNADSFPIEVHVQDDILLNKISFIDNNDHVIDTLYAEEQLVLLAYCSLVKRSSSLNELLQEELTSYLNCLLSQPRVWSVYITSLIIRCKMEKNRSRLIERAMMQMEAIVNSLNEELPPFHERQKFVFCLTFPPYWILQKELADLLLSLGCTKSALDIYEKLELWQEIIECYLRLGRTSSAEKLINEQMQKGETPLLWCLLGDVTEDPENYLKAWQLSNERSARAKRSLGSYYFKRKLYKESIPHFVTSLEINHIQPNVWFSLGCAATQTEDFELAARAYRQVVMFDEDNFEAWNNLANAYIKIKQKVRAWRSLQQALKCNYEEWRMWENFLLVSVDIGAFEDALRAWHRLFDIKGSFNDILILEILINAIIKGLPDMDGLDSGRLKKKALQLLGRITSVITNEPKIWELYSSLLASDASDNSENEVFDKIIRYQQKAVHCHNRNMNWEKFFNSSKDVLLCCKQLAEISVTYLKHLDSASLNQQKVSIKLNLQNVVARAEKSLINFCDEERDELTNIIVSIQSLLNEIINF